MSNPTKLVACTKCAKVYFAVSRHRAQEEVTAINKFYLKATEAIKAKLFPGGSSTIARYEACSCGASYKNFKDVKKATPGDMLLPIIDRKD